MMEIEILNVLEVVRSPFLFPGYNPKIVFCLVDRKVDLKLFYKSSNNVQNPSPGTCLDTTLVENQGDNTYDFFLISHLVTAGTAKPVHFRVAYNTSSLSK